MYRQTEAPVSRWGLPTRVSQLDEKLAELTRIRKFVPTREDLDKYSLTEKEVYLMFPNTHRFNDEPRINRWRNAMNGVMVVLRKRDVENPEMRISWYELREAINILIDDEPYGDVALFVIGQLEGHGFIDTNNWRYVNIVKPKTEIGGVVSVPF